MSATVAPREWTTGTALRLKTPNEEAAQRADRRTGAGMAPFVRDAPGFVAGYWIKLDDTHGTSVAVFETESQAQATVPSEDAPSPGVNLTSIKVGEVIGHT